MSALASVHDPRVPWYARQRRRGGLFLLTDPEPVRADTGQFAALSAPTEDASAVMIVAARLLEDLPREHPGVTARRRHDLACALNGWRVPR